MERQTRLQPADLSVVGVGLDDRPLALARPVSELDHRLGPPGAAVELVEYGDYECPFCVQAADGVAEVVSRFADRVLFVFRHFPLVSQHPHAWGAALAAEAAGAQDRFWEFHDHLLRRRCGLTGDAVRDCARVLGLDLPAFERDLRDPALAGRIRQDALGGLRSGVMGTPTFFVNGRRLEGGFRSGDLEAAVESSLTTAEDAR